MNDWRQVLSVAMLTNPGAAVGVLTPVFVNALTANGRFTLADASLIGAAELGGLTVALLLGPLFVHRFDRRIVALLGTSLAIAGQLASLTTPDAGMTATARFLAGGGVGALYAVAIAHLATSKSPDRAFGIVVTANHIVGAALLTTIAWLSNLYPARAAFLIVVAFQLMTALFIARLPGRGSSVTNYRTREPTTARTGVPALLGLFGIFLLATAFGSVWPIMGQIAAEEGILAGELTLAFSLAGAAGLLPGLVVTAIGLRAGRAVPLMLGSLAFGGSLMLPGSSAPFALATVLVMFFWTFNIPYHLGLVAALDRSGRLTVFASAMLPLGIAVGQAGSGQLAAVQGVNSVTIVGGALATAAGIMALLTLHVGRDLIKREPQDVSPA